MTAAHLAAMSAARATALVAQQGIMEAVEPAEITLNGTVYPAHVVALPIQAEQEEKTGLWLDKETIIIRIRKTVLATCPDQRSKIIYNGLEYFIPEKGQQKPTDIAWKLTAKRIVKS